MREMTLYGVSFEPIGKQPIVLLKTVDDDKLPPDLDRPPGGCGDPHEAPGRRARRAR